jgi:hypothetical protein
MIENKIYLFKEEFMPLLGITNYQYKYRKDDLMNWLKDFFNYEILKGKPIRINIIEQFGEYEALPKQGQEKITQQKQKDYEDYVIEHLPKEFTPMSKTRMSQNAINDFGKERYKHYNQEAVNRRYVGPAMDTHGEKTNERYWCWYKSYTQLEQEVLEDWRNILVKWKCTEKEVYAAFCEKNSTKDETEMVRLEGAFKAAMMDFTSKYGDKLVCIPKWKIAESPV